jgi:hypothetical protein
MILLGLLFCAAVYGGYKIFTNYAAATPAASAPAESVNPTVEGTTEPAPEAAPAEQGTKDE